MDTISVGQLCEVVTDDSGVVFEAFGELLEHSGVAVE
jgi:hypothetical protein